jgi:hypothetical protein
LRCWQWRIPGGVASPRYQPPYHTHTTHTGHYARTLARTPPMNAAQGQKTRQSRRSARQLPHRLGAMLMGATWCPHTYRRESKREAAMTQHTAQVSGNHPPHRTRCSHVLGYMPACLHVQPPSPCFHACLCMPPSHSPHLKSGCCHEPLHSPLSTTERGVCLSTTYCVFPQGSVSFHTLFPQKSAIVDLVEAELEVVGLRLHAAC